MRTQSFISRTTPTVMPSADRTPELLAGTEPTQATGDTNTEAFRILVNSVTDYAVFLLDRNGMITTWNVGAERIKGYRPDEIIGKHFSIFYLPEAREAELPSHALALALHDGRYEEEGWRVRKDGTRLWARVTITTLRAADGTHIGFSKVTRDLTDSKRSEEQLAAANVYLDTFRLLVDTVVDYAVFIHDAGGLITHWNAGAQQIKGYTRAEIVGKHFSLFYTPEAIAQGTPEADLAVAIRDGHLRTEGWRVRKDGSKFWACVVITVLRWPDGSLLGYGKVVRDLSEQKQIEARLLESNRLSVEAAANQAKANSYLTNILDASIFSAIIVTDLNEVITTFNRGAEIMLGYSADEVVGKTTPMVFHVAEEVEARRELLTKRLGRTVEKNEVFPSMISQQDLKQSEWTYVHKNGHRLTVCLSLSLVWGEDGVPMGYLGVAQDVTEQRRAAGKVSAAYDRLNAVLESMSDSVMTMSKDWTLLYCNPKGTQMIPDFAVGANYWTCFPKVAGTDMEKTLRRVMKTRVEASYEIFYEPYKKWYKGRIFPTDTGLSIFFSDHTEERGMQEQLALEQELREKRIEALSHMAGGLAHEISNPLAIIHARASDLASLAVDQKTVPADEVRKCCESIVKTSDRAMRILRGLRGFGREAESDPMCLVPVSRIVEDCLDLQNARFERHHIQLEVATPEDLPLLMCRETQIGQIITNLLNNSFDAIEQSKATERWVRLTAEQRGTKIVIRVMDSGPGIEEKFRAHLMDPFFTTKKLGLGMGVGLSLSRAIAQDHGGTLALCPDDMVNTCFELILPINHECGEA
jgi:PAS domain S-box-containing protein